MSFLKSLKVIHGPNLEDDKVEGFCMHVKAGLRDTLISATEPKLRMLHCFSNTT